MKKVQGEASDLFSVFNTLTVTLSMLHIHHMWELFSHCRPSFTAHLEINASHCNCKGLRRKGVWNETKEQLDWGWSECDGPIIDVNPKNGTESVMEVEEHCGIWIGGLTEYNTQKSTDSALTD